MQPEKDAFSFPRAFYVANILEIFERIAWYGFFTVSSLYMSTSPAAGGLGFSEQQRGILQGVIPFFVYVLPVVTGALGDRLGYRRMFLIAFAILTPCYFLLGRVNEFWPFFLVYMLVALGAAIFKPLVVGTVARSASDANRGRAFGIFYMMVNVGGFLGPVIAGYMRAISWEHVFALSSISIGLNLLIALFFLEKDASPGGGQIRTAFADAGEVIGNGRFVLLVVPIILGLMVAGGGWISWPVYGLFVLVWGGVQLVWNRFAHDDAERWYGERLQIGNGPFLIYLLTLSIFWAIYNQIFLTLPLYLRDFVDTSDLIGWVGQWSGSFASFLAPVDIESLSARLAELAGSSTESIGELVRQFTQYQVRVPEDALGAGLRALSSGEITAAGLAEAWASQYRQISPEYVIAVGFISIVLFQYLVSRWAEGRAPFGILIAGTAVLGLGFLISGMAHSAAIGGVLILAGMVVFAFGEMLAAPKSQEYVASTTPREQSALFMGYYFVSLAIGFLLAGIMSGWAYDEIALKANQPSIMWALFAGLAVVTMAGLFLFNRYLAPHMARPVSRAMPEEMSDELPEETVT